MAAYFHCCGASLPLQISTVMRLCSKIMVECSRTPNCSSSADIFVRSYRLSISHMIVRTTSATSVTVGAARSAADVVHFQRPSAMLRFRTADLRVE